MSSGNRLILVDDPEATFAIERRCVHTDAMLYGRPQKTGAAPPFGLLYASSQSRFQFENFAPDFIAALPVLEAYSQAINPSSGQPAWALQLHSNRLDDPDAEEIVRRWNFGQDLLLLFINLPAVNQTPDFMGIEQEYVDLCDDPWLEWVHPPADHAGTLQPYRNYFQPPPKPRQWSVTTWREPDWYGQADEYGERDTVSRAFRLDALRLLYPGIYSRGPFPAVQLELFQVQPTLGNIWLYWSPSPGAAGYRLYINGVPQPPVFITQILLIQGLTIGAGYGYNVVPVDGYGNDAGSLSNLMVYEHGTNELVTIESLPWENPTDQFPPGPPFTITPGPTIVPPPALPTPPPVSGPVTIVTQVGASLITQSGSTFITQ